MPGDRNEADGRGQEKGRSEALAHVAVLRIARRTEVGGAGFPGIFPAQTLAGPGEVGKLPRMVPQPRAAYTGGGRVGRSRAVPAAMRRRFELQGAIMRKPSLSRFVVLAGLWTACLAAPSPSPAADNAAARGLRGAVQRQGLYRLEGARGRQRALEGGRRRRSTTTPPSEAKGDKSLWTEREFGDFVLHVDWRIKETPYVNPERPYILPDGTHARDIHGKEIALALPDSDSGIMLRQLGQEPGEHLVLADRLGRVLRLPDGPQDCRPRSGRPSRRALRPTSPVGEWNRFEITVRGDHVSVVLNGKTVIPDAQLPGAAARGADRLAAPRRQTRRQVGRPARLLQFKNIYVERSRLTRSTRGGRGPVESGRER